MTTTAKRLYGWAALLLLVAWSGAPAGAEFSHGYQPRAGESWQQIARTHLGDERWAPLLAAANGSQGDRPEGAREVAIPSAAEHEWRPVDNWTELSRRYWGHAGHAPVLARFAGFGPGATPDVGQEIQIPALVEYRIRRGDTLVGLARRLYRNPDLGRSLARLNRLSRPDRIAVGQKIQLPVTARARTLPAVAAGPPEPVPEAVPAASPAPRKRVSPAAAAAAGELDLDAALRDAVNSWLEGRFSAARQQLDVLRPRVIESGTDAQQQRLLRHQIFVAVAFDDDASACEAYRALRRIAGEPDWDPDQISPKILRTLDGCTLTRTASGR